MQLVANRVDWRTENVNGDTLDCIVGKRMPAVASMPRIHTPWPGLGQFTSNVRALPHLAIKSASSC